MSMQLNCKSTVVSCRVFLSSEFLYVAYRKLLGLLSLEVFEVQLDFSHIGIQVARWYNLLGARNEPFLIVCAIEQDWNSCLEGNEVESLLPVGVERTGSLGCDAETEVVSLAGFLSQVVGHAGVLASPYRYSSHLAEDGSQWPEEPFLLHQEVALDSFGMSVELSDEEVPVAGMWSKTDNILLGMGYGNLLGPSQALIEYPFG